MSGSDVTVESLILDQLKSVTTKVSEISEGVATIRTEQRTQAREIKGLRQEATRLSALHNQCPAASGWKSALDDTEEIKEVLEKQRDRIDEIQNRPAQSSGKLDFGTLSGWLKVLPYIVLCIAAVAGLIIQNI